MHAAINTPPNIYPHLPAVAGAAAIQNGAPLAPQMMESQTAGRNVALGCGACAGAVGVSGLPKFPRWAKVLVTFGLLGAGIALVLIATRR